MGNTLPSLQTVLTPLSHLFFSSPLQLVQKRNKVILPSSTVPCPLPQLEDHPLAPAEWQRLFKPSQPAPCSPVMPVAIQPSVTKLWHNDTGRCQVYKGRVTEVFKKWGTWDTTYTLCLFCDLLVHVWSSFHWKSTVSQQLNMRKAAHLSIAQILPAGQVMDQKCMISLLPASGD